MPRGKAMAVCTTPGCPVLVEAPPGGRCPAHQQAANRRRGSSHSKGYDARWQRTRKAYLRAHPTCECDDCLQLVAIMRPFANEVDHIDGLGPNGPRGHDWSNLRSMTKAHHSRATALAQPGGWNDRA